MILLVLDASATGPIILNDESSDALPGLADALARDGACVPALWHLEVANAIRIARVRGRLDTAAERDAKQLADALLLEVDEHTREKLFTDTWALSERHELTIYDAVYLELARRRGLPLATHDSALIVAARRESVALFGR